MIFPYDSEVIMKKRIDFENYTPEGFIKKYQELVRSTVIPYQYDVLWDRAGNTEKSHVVQNFINAGRAVRGEDTGDGFYGMVFQDSDAAKWLEAVGYSLAVCKDEELERRADELIDIIADAQDKDGYLDTYFTIKDRDKRWTNLCEAHELYCSGHMIEAACAYYEATGKRKLLDVMTRNVEHIYEHFVTQDREGFPGHPEIELALLKMYRLTGNEKAKELAFRFIDKRGTDPSIFIRECKERSWTVWGSDGADLTYMQADRPVRELENAAGHAVRAVYLYTAMAQMAALTGDSKLKAAVDRLWESITKRRMYITGGIGSTGIGEAFSEDYDLPNDTAYCETCASLGLMFFGAAMNELENDAVFADISERAFYNTALAGMQLDGRKFFYVNVLESRPGISGKSVTHRHTVPERPGWYACACCPPNLARTIMSFGQYAFSETEDTAFVEIYAAGSVRFDNGCELEISTGYPYDTDITIKAVKGKRVALRIPSWSKTYTITVNGSEHTPSIENGYAYIDVKDGDTISLILDGEPHWNYPSVRIPSLSGMAALSKGPLVYCFEGADNGGDVYSLSADTHSKVEISENTALGTDMLTIDAVRSDDTDGLYSMDEPAGKAVKAHAVPYYAWCNRGANQMRVWMRKK